MWCNKVVEEELAIKSDIWTQWQEIEVEEDNVVEEDPETLTEVIEEATNKRIPYTFYTSENALVNVYPISHATTVVEWGDTTIYIDPAESVDSYEGFNAPDMIFITHIHGDHLNKEVLEALYNDQVEIIVPASVNQELNSELQTYTTVMGLEEIRGINDFNITSVPAYNIREEALNFHPRDRGDSGYIIERDGLRMYFSGDSEDTPEMRALSNIDVAFVSMNLPYTMTAESAASAVLDFAPKTVFPYHYRGKEGLTDIESFKSLVQQWNANIEVILHDWYGE